MRGRAFARWAALLCLLPRGTPREAVFTVETVETVTVLERRNASCFDLSSAVSLEGMHFSVTAIEFWPHTFQADGEWQGIYFEVWRAIASAEGFTFSVEAPSQNTWDAAVEDIAAGRFDFAVGPWFLSAKRLEKVDSAGVIECDILRVLTPHGTSRPPLLDQMFMFLQPFSTGLWWLIFASICATGIAAYFMESANIFDFIPELKEAPGGSRCSLIGIVKSIWLTALTFTGSDGHDPDSWPGRWLIGFWLLVVSVIISTYTAALANAFSAVMTIETGVQSANDFVTQKLPACVLSDSALATWAAKEYPGVKRFARGSYDELFELVRARTRAATRASPRVRDVLSARAATPRVSQMNAGTCAGLIDSQIDTISWQVPNDQCDGFIWVGQELHEWKSGFLGQLANAELNRVVENRVHMLREMGVVDEARSAIFEAQGYGGCGQQVTSDLTLQPIHLRCVRGPARPEPPRGLLAVASRSSWARRTAGSSSATSSSSSARRSARGACASRPRAPARGGALASKRGGEPTFRSRSACRFLPSVITHQDIENFRTSDSNVRRRPKRMLKKLKQQAKERQREAARQAAIQAHRQAAALALVPTIDPNEAAAAAADEAREKAEELEKEALELKRKLFGGR